MKTMTAHHENHDEMTPMLGASRHENHDILILPGWWGWGLPSRRGQRTTEHRDAGASAFQGRWRSAGVSVRSGGSAA